MFNVTKNNKIFYIIPVVIIVIGIIMGNVNGGFNLDTEFIGGTSITIDMGKDFSDAELNNFAEKALGKDVTVQKSEGNKAVIRTVEINNDEKAALLAIEKQVSYFKSLHMPVSLRDFGIEDMDVGLLADLCRQRGYQKSIEYRFCHGSGGDCGVRLWR